MLNLIRRQLKILGSISGMTLVELIIGVGLLSIVGVIGSTVSVMVINQTRDKAYEVARRELRSDLSVATRGPRQLRLALGTGSPPLVPCLAITNTPAAQPTCAASAAFAGFSASLSGQAGAGAPLTNAIGVGCMNVKGEQCPMPPSGVCSANCPVRFETEFRMSCAGTRPTCPSNQANLIVRYSIAPESTAADRDKFRPVRAVQVIQPKTLWGDINKLGEGAAAVELTSEPNKQTVSCAAGEIMIGVDVNGQPICEPLTAANQRCGPGQVFTGYTVDGGTQRLVATCVSNVCPDLGGKKRVFSGYDSTGTIICNVINPTNAVCNPGTAAAPTGIFMTGLDSNAGAPVCRKKTCLPGEIFARLAPDGSVVCKRTDPWIPRCPVGPCTAPPEPDALPPAVGTFYSDTTTPAVSVGYNGVPWISSWVDGEPMQGYRMTFKNFSGSSSTPTVGSLYVDSLAGLGIKTCQLNGVITDTTKHTCQHFYRRVDRPVGQCPPGPYTFFAPNSCALFGPSPSFGCATFEIPIATVPPAAAGWIGTCGTPYNASYAVVLAGTIGRCCAYNSGYLLPGVPSEVTSAQVETFPVTAFNFNNGSSGPGTAECVSPSVPHNGNVSGATPTGFGNLTTYNHTYNATVRASCNYLYPSP